MNKIKQRREELGLSQAKLGKMIGCSQQHINRFELGYEIKPDKVLKLSESLNLPVEDIISEKWLAVFNKLSKKAPVNDVSSTVATVVKVVEDFLNDHNKKLTSEKKAQLIAGLVAKLSNTPPEEQKKLVEFAISLELDKQAV